MIYWSYKEPKYGRGTTQNAEIPNRRAGATLRYRNVMVGAFPRRITCISHAAGWPMIHRIPTGTFSQLNERIRGADLYLLGIIRV